MLECSGTHSLSQLTYVHHAFLQALLNIALTTSQKPWSTKVIPLATISYEARLIVLSPEQMQMLTANGIFLEPESWKEPDESAGLEFELDSHDTLEGAS